MSHRCPQCHQPMPEDTNALPQGGFHRWRKRNPLGATVIGLLVLIAVGGPLVAVNQMRLAKEVRQEKERADQLVVELNDTNIKLTQALKAEMEAKELANRNLQIADDVVQSFLVEIARVGGLLSQDSSTQPLRKKTAANGPRLLREAASSPAADTETEQEVK